MTATGIDVLRTSWENIAPGLLLWIIQVRGMPCRFLNIYETLNREPTRQYKISFLISSSQALNYP